jgi:hypothetical protein
MATTVRSTVVGVFENGHQAKQAVDELRRAGFREEQIGVAGRHADEGSKVGEGAATGAAVGAGVGALWAIGIAAGVLPVIGPVIAGGLLASVLASAAGGAVAGGIVGALVGLGIPENEASYYEEEFKAGRTLVTVKADSRANEAWGILARNGAYNMETCGQAVGSPR